VPDEPSDLLGLFAVESAMNDDTYVRTETRCSVEVARRTGRQAATMRPEWLSGVATEWDR
jgi:hypothetical protein